MMKTLKILQVVGVLMLGIGIALGYQDGSFTMATLGLLLFAGAKVTQWVQSKND
jgi:hypothetical protein